MPRTRRFYELYCLNSSASPPEIRRSITPNRRNNHHNKSVLDRHGLTARFSGSRTSCYRLMLRACVSQHRWISCRGLTLSSLNRSTWWGSIRVSAMVALAMIRSSINSWAVMAFWEFEQSLQSLTGVSPGEGTGATMSGDDDDQVDSDTNLFDGSLEGADILGFGPLVPTESERSLMERVRQELKHELKQGYKEKIVDIREEILCKRRAGKLPGDTTSMLKAWWQSHSKWPYPTVKALMVSVEEDKARLVQEAGLQLKQINNWFINQRKRNWHSNSSTSKVLKSKRKRYANSSTCDNSGDRFM
ncbi:unnamed protein product [Camellia sinensis]